MQTFVSSPCKISDGWGGGIKMGLFLQTSKFHFCCCVAQYVYCIMLFRTLCRKPYFLRYRQLEVGGVTLYDKGERQKTVLNHCKSALDVQ